MVQIRPVPWIASCVLVLAVAGCREHGTVEDGPQAPQPPRQWNTDAAPFELGHFELTPRAEIALSARLLKKRRYRRGRLTPLSPWDFALGWGAMSDSALLRHVSLTQGDRFLFRHALQRGLAMERIERLSANVHLIPANDNIAHRLERAPVDALLSLRGLLVDLRDRRDNSVYPTSLSRGDRGAGACEILYLTAIEMVPPRHHAARGQ